MSVLKLDSDQSKSSKVEAHRHRRSFAVRIRKAVRVSVPFFIAAVVGVFIPFLHFVIVPSALIAMLALAAREMNTRESFNVDKISCPHCQVPYEETEFVRLPRRLICFNCRVASTLSYVEATEIIGPESV